MFLSCTCIVFIQYNFTLAVFPSIDMHHQKYCDTIDT